MGAAIASKALDEVSRQGQAVLHDAHVALLNLQTSCMDCCCLMQHLAR